MNNGLTAIAIAALRGYPLIVKYLHENGADLNLIGNRTVLHIGVVGGNMFVVEYLVNTAKLDVNQVDEEGNTPMSLASLNGQLDVVKFLIENGAKI